MQGAGGRAHVGQGDAGVGTLRGHARQAHGQDGQSAGAGARRCAVGPCARPCAAASGGHRDAGAPRCCLPRLRSGSQPCRDVAAHWVQVHEEVLRLLLAAAPQLPVPQLTGYLQVGPACLLHCIAGSSHQLSWKKPIVAISKLCMPCPCCSCTCKMLANAQAQTTLANSRKSRRRFKRRKAESLETAGQAGYSSGGGGALGIASGAGAPVTLPVRATQYKCEARDTLRRPASC